MSREFATPFSSSRVRFNYSFDIRVLRGDHPAPMKWHPIMSGLPCSFRRMDGVEGYGVARSPPILMARPSIPAAHILDALAQ